MTKFVDHEAHVDRYASRNLYNDFWSITLKLYVRDEAETRALYVARNAFPKLEWDQGNYTPIKENDAGTDSVIAQIGPDKYLALKWFEYILQSSHASLQGRVFTASLTRASDWR